LGQDPHGIIFDEVIAQRTRELWDALKSGMGSRRQPLMIAATTAGNDPHGFAANEHSFSERVAHDPKLDPSRFVFMRNLATDADWTDEANWYAPNPALGDFLSLDVLRAELKEALANPATENRFRQFRCNQWVQQSTRWLPLARWDDAGGAVDERSLVGRQCFGGLDLSATQDTSALCWTFDDGDGYTSSLWRFWIPEERIPAFDERTGGQASAWVRAGFLRATEGDVIDHESILEQIKRDAHTFDIRELAYDPNGAAFLVQRIIAEAGVDCFQHDQHFGAMSPAVKEWEKRILERRYRHGGQPVMRWQFDSIQVRTDDAGRVRIDRKSSRDKVDGAVAAVMSLGRLVASPPSSRSRVLRSF
jgi:phage terminase large subunit-like protein